MNFQIDVTKMPIVMHNGLFHDSIVCIHDICTGYVFTRAIWSDCMAEISRAVMDVFCRFGPPGLERGFAIKSDVYLVFVVFI